MNQEEDTFNDTLSKGIILTGIIGSVMGLVFIYLRKYCRWALFGLGNLNPPPGLPDARQVTDSQIDEELAVPSTSYATQPDDNAAGPSTSWKVEPCCKKVCRAFMPAIPSGSIVIPVEPKMEVKTFGDESSSSTSTDCRVSLSNTQSFSDEEIKPKGKWCSKTTPKTGKPKHAIKKSVSTERLGDDMAYPDDDSDGIGFAVKGSDSMNNYLIPPKDDKPEHAIKMSVSTDSLSDDMDYPDDDSDGIGFGVKGSDSMNNYFIPPKDDRPPSPKVKKGSDEKDGLDN